MIARWHKRGKYPAVYIPRAIARALNWTTGENLEIETDKNKVYIKKTDKAHTTVQSLGTGQKYVTLPVSITQKRKSRALSKSVNIEQYDNIISIEFL